jgi:hypothetical protein
MCRSGRLMLVKSFLEVILVYWHRIVSIPKGIPEKIKMEHFKYLWSGNKDKDRIALVNGSIYSKQRNWDDGGQNIFFSSRNP